MAAVARRAGADMEFVADMPGDRSAVLHRDREFGAEPVIGTGRARVPAGPDKRVAAAKAKAEPGILPGFRIVGAGRIVRRHIVEQVEDALRTAIGYVVDEDAAGAPHILGPQDVEIGGVFDEALVVAWRLVEIDDTGVFRRVRVQHAMRDAAKAHISPGLAELMAVGKIRDLGDADRGYGHGGSSPGRFTFSRSRRDSGSSRKASSSGVDTRSRTALRCGKRPNRSMMSR